MFKNLFNPDNPLMITMSQVTDCIFLSLFWVLTSFPLITIGASSAALYDAVYYGYRQGDKHSWGRFFRSFKNNLKPSILPALVYLAVFCAGGWGLIQIWNAAVWEQVSFAAFSAAAFVVVVLLGILSVMFPMLSRFHNSFFGLLRNTGGCPYVNGLHHCLLRYHSLRRLYPHGLFQPGAGTGKAVLRGAFGLQILACHV